MNKEDNALSAAAEKYADEYDKDGSLNWALQDFSKSDAVREYWDAKFKEENKSSISNIGNPLAAMRKEIDEAGFTDDDFKEVVV